MHTNQVTEAQIQEVINEDHYNKVFQKRSAILFYNYKIENLDNPFWYSVMDLHTFDERNFSTNFADAVEYYNQL